MAMRRLLTALALVAFASQLGGCGWWHKRQVKKTFESVKEPVTTALQKMKDADAKVIAANKALSAASDSHADTDVLVEKIHDFAVALQAGVPAAKAFQESLKGMGDGDETRAVGHTVSSAYLDYNARCGGQALKLDDIDPCGGAYDEMLGAAYVFVQTAKEYDVDFPVVRAPEKDAKD